MTKFNSKIGEQLRDARTLNRYSCEDMAKYLKCAKSTYSTYERGLSSIPTESLLKACNYLKLDWIEVISNAKK